MAEHGEWNRKGAILSDVTAQREYGVTRDFIVEGIRSGKLEFREGAVWATRISGSSEASLSHTSRRSLAPST
jgi:hypothetical protein